LITFNAIEGGLYRGFVHPDNLNNELGNIEFPGGTHIMDGWGTMLRTSENFFPEQHVATCFSVKKFS